MNLQKHCIITIYILYKIWYSVEVRDIRAPRRTPDRQTYNSTYLYISLYCNNVWKVFVSFCLIRISSITSVLSTHVINMYMIFCKYGMIFLQIWIYYRFQLNKLFNCISIMSCLSVLILVLNFHIMVVWRRIYSIPWGSCIPWYKWGIPCQGCTTHGVKCLIRMTKLGFEEVNGFEIN